MAKSPKIKLDIPAPCHENWDNMTPNEKGRHCTNCNKTVIDFSAYNDKELLEFFNKVKGNICGRLNEFQINRPIAIPVKNNSFFQRIFFGTALATGSALTAQSQVVNHSIPPVQIPVPDTLFVNRSLPIVIPPKQTQDILTYNISDKSIICRVIDSVNRQAMPFVGITIQDSSAKVYSDMDGKIEYAIPAQLQGKEITLHFYFPGYNDKAIVFKPVHGSDNSQIPPKVNEIAMSDLSGDGKPMAYATMVCGGIGFSRMTVVKETLWHKITHPFRKRYSAELKL